MSETIDATLLRLQTIIANASPNIDVGPGTVFNELVIKQNSTLQNPITNSISAIDQGNSISQAINSQVDTFNPTIDEIASNYNVVRNPGTISTGSIKVVVADKRNYFLQTGFIFNQPVLNLNYITASTYTVTTTPSSTTDLPLVITDSGYYFIVPVVAANVGSQYQVSDNTEFTVDPSNTITGFVSANAYGNFTTGIGLETDKALIARFQQGIANKSLLTKNSINFRLLELYPTLSDLSVIGANDAEMTRSKENLFGISTLGMADVYVRTSLGPTTILITKPGIKISTRTDGTLGRIDTWQLSFDYKDVSGFYRIVSILPSGLGLTGTLVNTPTYNYSTTGFAPANTVNNLLEGRFTQYQSCITTFDYTLSDATISTTSFDTILSYQPNIGDIQNLFLNSSERIACADYLVKAAIPCYVSLNITLHKLDSTVSLPTDQIKADIFSYINSIKFGESLYASQLVRICHNYNVLYVDLPITLTGDIYTPTGPVITISNNDILTIPTNLPYGVSPKTTVFLIDYFKSSELRNTMSDSIGLTVI